MPSEFSVGGVAYRCRSLSAARQFEILHRLEPVLPALTKADVGLRIGGRVTPRTIATLFGPLEKAGDDTLDAVFADALSAVERADGGPVGQVGLAGLMVITAEVVRHNFAALFAMERPKFEPCPASDREKGFGDFEPVAMPGGADWLYQPMHAGFCTYRELHDGSLRIEDVARMNDLLLCRNENEARLRYVAEQG